LINFSCFLFKADLQFKHAYNGLLTKVKEMNKNVFRDIKSSPASQQKSRHLADAHFKYIPSIKTDIVKKFRNMGWVPPSEIRSFE